MRKAALILLFLASSAAIAGQPCATPVVQTYAAPIVYQPTYVLPAVFVPVPSYTVGLSFSDSRLDEILQRLESIESARPAAIAEAPSVAAVLTSTCMRCHAVGTPPEKSGGYTFDPAGLSLGDRRRILDQVLAGTMPKGQPLTEAQRTAVRDGLVH